MLGGVASASTVSFFANPGTTTANENTHLFDTPTYVGSTGQKFFSIAYAIQSNWNVTSAKLALKLTDDQCIAGHGSACPETLDAPEQAKVFSLEGYLVSVPTVEIDSYGWYEFNVPDLLSLILTSTTSPLTGAVRPINNARPSTADFSYKNAKLVLTYDEVVPTPPVPVPAALWLFGSALVGMSAVSRKKAR
ncbi:hypothetical protein [Methylosoma difficile]